MFDVVDMDADGFISSEEFARFMHGCANIRGALVQWENINLNGEELRRVNSGAASIGDVLGRFQDTPVSDDEARKVLHYFTKHLDTDGDGLISRSEFCHAVSTELWAGMLVRSFSQPPAAASAPPAGVVPLSRQASIGLVRTKSALSRTLNMPREQIDVLQRLLPAFTCADLQGLLTTLRQRSSALSFGSAPALSVPEFKTVLAQSDQTGNSMSASFFSYLFDRADDIASAGGDPAPDLGEYALRKRLVEMIYAK